MKKILLLVLVAFTLGLVAPLMDAQAGGPAAAASGKPLKVSKKHRKHRKARKHRRRRIRRAHKAHAHKAPVPAPHKQH